MKATPSDTRPCGRPRRSLEQKIMLLVRSYRAAERRRRRIEAAGTNYRRRLGVLPRARKRLANVNSSKRRMSLCRKRE